MTDTRLQRLVGSAGLGLAVWILVATAGFGADLGIAPLFALVLAGSAVVFLSLPAGRRRSGGLIHLPFAVGMPMVVIALLGTGLWLTPAFSNFGWGLIAVGFCLRVWETRRAGPRDPGAPASLPTD